MKVMLLAAGRGERMRPLTDACPKPLLPVAGKPLVVWHLERLAAAGLRDVVMNLSWLGEQIASALGDGARFGVRIQYSREPWPALETGGGIFHALPLLGTDPFLLVNGDVFTDIDFTRVALGPADLAQLVMVANPEQHPQGDFWLEGDRIVATPTPGTKLTALPARRCTYSGIAMLRPAFFEGAAPGRFPLLPWLQRALQQGRLGGQFHAGRWLDVGTPERLRVLDAELGPVRP